MFTCKSPPLWRTHCQRNVNPASNVNVNANVNVTATVETESDARQTPRCRLRHTWPGGFSDTRWGPETFSTTVTPFLCHRYTPGSNLTICFLFKFQAMMWHFQLWYTFTFQVPFDDCYKTDESCCH